MTDSITNHMLRVWGAQWRRIALGGTIVRGPDGEILHRHIDGYPTSSLSNFKDKIGFGTGGEQQWAEVYTGDGLIIHRGMQRLAELQRTAVVITYGVRAPDGKVYGVRDRAEFLGMTRTIFWQTLNAAEQRLIGFVEGLREVESDRELSGHFAGRESQHMRGA